MPSDTRFSEARGPGKKGTPAGAGPERDDLAVSDAPRPLPLWIQALGSAFVLFHFLAIGGLVLGAGSGPWPTPFGQSDALGPQFALAINQQTYPRYLEPLRLTHNYHFAANRVSVPEVKFEIKLFDRSGRVLKTLNFPESASNPWMRHRLDLLAQNLYGDLPVDPRFGEAVAPPGKLVRSVNIWEPDKDGVNRIRSTPEHLIPRNRPVFRPSPWSELVAQAYVRYQCRLHGAASGELIRRSKEAVQPSLIFLPDPPAAAFLETAASFGKVTP